MQQQIRWDTLTVEERVLVRTLIGTVKQELANYLARQGIEAPEEVMVRAAPVLWWIRDTAEFL